MGRGVAPQARPPLCLLCVAGVTREEPLDCYCFSPVAQGFSGSSRLFCSFTCQPRTNATYRQPRSLPRDPGPCTKVAAGRPHSETQASGSVSRPEILTARASCWGAVCSQARRPCPCPGPVGPSSSQPLSPPLSTAAARAQAPTAAGVMLQPPHWFSARSYPIQFCCPLAALQG